MPRRPKPESGPPRLGYMLSPDPVRAAFQRRSLDALNRIATQAPTESLANALVAPTDIGALARILSDGEAIGPAIPVLDPLAPLIARNAEHRLDLLARCGGTLTAAEAGALLGISRQAVDKRRRLGGLIALRQGGSWHYPRCQFDEARGEPVAGLARLLAALPDRSAWTLLDFLLAPDQALGAASPLDMLRKAGWTDALDRLARIERGDGFG